MADSLFPELEFKYVDISVERLINAYQYSQQLGLGKLYIAFSGGKDSCCCYGLAKLASEKLGMELSDFAEFHYNITNVDPPELVRFIRNVYKPLCNVIMEHPKKTMWQLIVEKKMPPTRLIRYCCMELKEHGGENRFCVTGVRRAESVKRSERKGFEIAGNSKADKILFGDNEIDRREIEQCQLKRKWICNPIIDWSDEDVWNFIKEYNIPYCELYDKGYKRLGCIGCPMNTQKQELERYPKYKEQYIRSFDKMVKAYKDKPCSWKNGQDVYDWWIGKSFESQKQKEQFDFGCTNGK